MNIFTNARARNSRRIVVIVLAVGVLMPAFAFAQQPPLLPNCDPLPGRTPRLSGTDHYCGFADLIQLAINIYNLLLYFASFIALLMIVWAGVRMLWFSYFENSETELGEAKLTLTRAITGLVIIIAAYLIVNTLVVFLTGDREGINSVLRGFGLFN